MPQHAAENLPPQLGMKYLVWSRAVELMLISRACALVGEPHQYFGRGTMLQRRIVSLARRGPVAQSFRCPTLAFWYMVSARLHEYWKLLK
eukprot:4235127-Pyramimonas_sp.AAC.1